MDIAHFFPYDKEATTEMNSIGREHQLMPFDVKYLGASLGDLTWLTDHETGAKQEADVTVYAADGSKIQVEPSAVRETRRIVAQDPLRALNLLSNAYIESLPESMRMEIMQRRQELKVDTTAK